MEMESNGFVGESNNSLSDQSGFRANLAVCTNERYRRLSLRKLAYTRTDRFNLLNGADRSIELERV